MKETFIQGIFPVPIYITSLDREFSSSEINFVNKNKNKINKNEGNITSENSYILNSSPFKKLKKELDLIILDYFEKIINPINKIIPYITQSWLNYTEENQFHHQHEHPNSLVSGVVYIDADEKYDSIKFFKRDPQSTIKIFAKDFNFFNSESWMFPVKTGSILLFPSSTTHRVEIKKGLNTRISLAFNVFIKGTIGDKKSLTELKI